MPRSSGLASSYVCPGDDAAEPFVIGVVVAPDHVPADHAGLLHMAGVVRAVEREVPQRRRHRGRNRAPEGTAAPRAAHPAAALLRQPDPGRDRRTARHLPDARLPAAGPRSRSPALVPPRPGTSTTWPRSRLSPSDGQWIHPYQRVPDITARGHHENRHRTCPAGDRRDPDVPVTTNTSVFNLHIAGVVIMLTGLAGLFISPARRTARSTGAWSSDVPAPGRTGRPWRQRRPATRRTC
jgi:hypothetical protein